MKYIYIYGVYKVCLYIKYIYGIYTYMNMLLILGEIFLPELVFLA